MKTLLFIFLFIYLLSMKQKWIFLMTKGTVHKEDRHHKPLDTLTTRKQRYIEQKSINIREKKNMYNFTETS